MLYHLKIVVWPILTCSLFFLLPGKGSNPTLPHLTRRPSTKWIDRIFTLHHSLPKKLKLWKLWRKFFSLLHDIIWTIFCIRGCQTKCVKPPCWLSNWVWILVSKLLLLVGAWPSSIFLRVLFASSCENCVRCDALFSRFSQVSRFSRRNYRESLPFEGILVIKFA